MDLMEGDMLTKEEYIEELESALIDLLAGNELPSQIRTINQMSDERSVEISDLYRRVEENYTKKHNIR
jgi:hypothetical protein